MKLFALIGLYILMASLPVSSFAEGEDSSESGKDKQQPRLPEPVVIRQVSPIEDYQPLTVAGQTVAATYTEEKLGKRHGAIILLPDQGEQIDSYGVIHAIKTQLPLYGWSILSLDMYYPFEPNIFLATEEDASVAAPTSNASEAQPAVAKEQAERNDKGKKEGKTETTNTKESLPPVSNQARIEAAITFLQGKNIDRIIFLGHGEGGQVAITTLDTLQTPVQALVLVGTGQLDAETNNIFATFDMPVLDIAGSQESAIILQALKNRRIIMKRQNHLQYMKKEISGADHFFTGLQDDLTTLVRGWLRKHFIEQDKR